MAISTKKSALPATSPNRKRLKIIGLLLVLPLILITPQISKPTYGQSGGELNLWFASGYPEKLPADGKSTTILEATTEDCNFGVPIDSNGSFFVNGGSPATISLLDGDISKEPLRFLLTAPSEPGMFVIEFELSYCPPGAIALMGVCSDPAYANVKCHGWKQILFDDPEYISEETGQTDNPDAVASEQAASEQAMSEEARPEQAMSENEASSEMTAAELYQDLEEFLAEEGISAPTPRQIGTSGIAITTLLAGWLVLNQMSGTSAERSLEVIKAWKNGEQPPIGAEVDLPADLGDGDVGLEGDLPQESPDSVDEEQSVPIKRSPVQESGEDRLLRGVQDTQDLDNALKQTQKDFETFENKVPPAVKNSEAWKKHVEPRIKQVKDLMKKGELDKGRTWLDRSEQLIKLRQDVDRDLGYLPDDKREAIVWTERTLKTLGHFASDTYQTLVVDPAKAAGEKILPGEQAQKWNKAMDELNQELSNVAQQIGELPRKGARLYTHGKLQEMAPQEHKELYGEREVKVEYPDFMGKGTAKVHELWDHTMRCLFHDR